MHKYFRNIKTNIKRNKPKEWKYTGNGRKLGNREREKQGTASAAPTLQAISRHSGTPAGTPLFL